MDYLYRAKQNGRWLYNQTIEDIRTKPIDIETIGRKTNIKGGIWYVHEGDIVVKENYDGWCMFYLVQYDKENDTFVLYDRKETIPFTQNFFNTDGIFINAYVAGNKHDNKDLYLGKQLYQQ